MAQYQLQWPPLTAKFKTLAIVLFTLWFATLVEPVDTFVTQNLLVSSGAILQGQIWTVFTYAFWHADFLHLLFNLWILWIFGSELEQRWSDAHWWRFHALCALGGGLFVVGSQFIFQTAYPTLGYSGVVMGVVAAFAWYNWDRVINFFFFSLRGKNILLLFITIDVLLVVVGREPISIAAHLGGMLTGLLLASGFWRPTKLKQNYRRWKQRRRFKVIRKEAEADVKRRYMN